MPETQNDLTITTLLCFMLLLLAILGLLALLLTLLKHNRKQQQQSIHLVANLLTQQTQENQSLRNQLRAGDLQALHGLQAATGTTQGFPSEDYVPTDEDLLFKENLETAGYGTQEPPNDLAARGWDSIPVSRTDGGSPVIGT